MKRMKAILKLLSSLMILIGVLLFIPMIAILLTDDPKTLFGVFGLIGGGAIIIGFVMRLMTRKVDVNLDLPSAMMLCTFAWVLLSLIGGLPLMFGLDISFTDAFFESVSGFTTTGITVLQGLDTMPYAILFWRSLIQWFGGLGILTFFLFITTNADGEIWQLFSAEGHKISGSRPVPNVYRTIQYFWLIYGGLTLLEILVLWLLKVPAFEAIIHSLSTLSTGGFSNHDASIGFYQLSGHPNYIWIEYTIILFMFMGGVNFLIHYKTLKEDKFIIFKDIESKGYMKIIGGFTAITLIGIAISRGITLEVLEETVRKTLFQIVSLITTTGFGTEDIGSAFFPVVTKQLFIVLMIVGGCVGSTSGGIKVLRVIILQKLLRREIERVHLPGSAVLPTTIGGNPIGHNEINRIAALVFGWILLIIIGSGITALFSDLGPFEAFSGMASAVGNIGPFYFTVEKMASLSFVVKYTFIIGMLAGRLELIPLYIFISKRAFNTR